MDSRSVIVFLSGKFSEMGEGSEKGQFGFGCGHKIMMEVGAYRQGFISKKPNQIFHYDETGCIKLL